MKIKLTHDLFNITRRIKSIDSHYEIVFDTERVCFEIHNSRQVDNTFCLSVDNDSLDARVLDKVYKTRSENIDEIMEQIDQHNERLQSQMQNAAREKISEAILKRLK